MLQVIDMVVCGLIALVVAMIYIALKELRS
jgi:hypothetical protein